jgi:hypothetical protein
MWRRVALVRSDVSEECFASIIRVKKFSELGTAIATTNDWRNSDRLSVLQLLVTANVLSSLILSTLMMEAIHSFETSVLTRATRHHTQEDGNLHSHRRDNLKSYITYLAGLCNGDVMCLLWGTNSVFISQKTAFFIVTVVRTSNLVCYMPLPHIWVPVSAVTGEPHQRSVIWTVHKDLSTHFKFD